MNYIYTFTSTRVIYTLYNYMVVWHNAWYRNICSLKITEFVMFCDPSLAS